MPEVNYGSGGSLSNPIVVQPGTGSSAGQWRVNKFYIAGVGRGGFVTAVSAHGGGDAMAGPYATISGGTDDGAVYHWSANTYYYCNVVKSQSQSATRVRWGREANSQGLAQEWPGSQVNIQNLPASASTSGCTLYTESNERGGAAGGIPNQGGTGIHGANDFDIELGWGFDVVANGGGDGIIIRPPGSGTVTYPFQKYEDGGNATCTIFGGTRRVDSGAGGFYGGGRGGRRVNGDNNNSIFGGLGASAPGRVWYTYIEPTSTIPTQIGPGESFDVDIDSYWDGVSTQTINVPTNASTGVQAFIVSDSMGAETRLYVEVVAPPEIDSFTAQDQLNTNGIPTDDVTFSWSLTDISNVPFTVEIYRGSIDPLNLLYSTGAQLIGSATVSTGLQSEVGVNSPDTDTFILKVTISGGSFNEASTVASVYNDNDPTSITVSSGAIAPGGTRPLSALESNTLYYTTVIFSGVDMPLIATPTSSGTNVSNNGINWTAGELIIQADGTLYVRFTSLPFNTDTTPGGTNAQGEIIGQINTRTISFNLGTDSESFNATTRAPVIQETFNFEIPINAAALPSPDIDTIITPNPTIYLTTDASIQMDDIEIPVEAKTDDGNAQIRVNGAWFDMREI